MYYYLFGSGMLLLCIPFSYAQSSSTLIGGRAAGLAYSSSCLRDEWAIFNNIGGLGKVERAAVALTYDAQPSFKAFNRMSAVIALPTKVGVAGAGLFRFGDQLFSEQILALGFANTFGLASLGLKVSYIQYKAKGFGTKGIFALSFGGIANLTEKLSVGAHIINLNQPTLSAADGEKLPTILVIGGAVNLSPQTLVTTELEKNLGYTLKWKTGVEYQPYKKIMLRTGFQLNPATAFFGFGFRPKKLSLDYSFQHNFLLGSRHQATLGYFIGASK
ncbi:MAG TPA: hypothetical protein VFZ52_17135 [Chryseolinea sp.]